MIYAALVFVAASYVFAYHYERNGNPWPIGDFAQRLVWSFVFAAGFALIKMAATDWLALTAYFAGQFIAITAIPHAFAQNMGNRTMAWADMPRIPLAFGITLPKWWPAYWLKPFLTNLNNTQQDFLGMATVGALRGMIVYLPAITLGAAPFHALAAAAITLAAQPLAYLAGRFTPWSAFGNTAGSAAWGEFFVPIGWALATYVAA